MKGLGSIHSLASALTRFNTFNLGPSLYIHPILGSSLKIEPDFEKIPVTERLEFNLA